MIWVVQRAFVSHSAVARTLKEGSYILRTLHATPYRLHRATGLTTGQDFTGFIQSHSTVSLSHVTSLSIKYTALYQAMVHATDSSGARYWKL